MIPEIFFELCSGQKCGLQTDQPTSAKQYTPASSKGGINMAIIMTLWIGNGAVLESSSQWQLKEF